MRTAACLLMVLTALCVSQVHPQTLTTPGGSCCGVNLMDSSDHVVLEASPFDIGTEEVTFRAFRVHLCCITRTFVQVWRRLPEQLYQLVWQMPVQASVFQVNSVKHTIFTIPEGLRLQGQSDQNEFYMGMWSPGTDKHCIPYKFLKNSSLIIKPSLERYGSEGMIQEGTVIEMDELLFPRTITNSITFCRDPVCGDADEDGLPIYGSAVAGPAGPPGKDGEQGRPGTGIGDLGDFPLLSCDVGELMNDDIDAIKTQNQMMMSQIEDLSSMLNSLTNSNIVTGTCKTGGHPGSYGLGNCYFLSHGPEGKISYAEAILACRDRYEAKLADIESYDEEVFLKRLIMDKVGTADPDGEEYFLSAMWSTKSQQYYWYDELTKNRRGLLYSNWGTDYSVDEIIAGYKHCVVMDIDFNRDVSKWTPTMCQEKKYFICKMPKKCM